MITIKSPNELPSGWLRMWSVKDEEEAQRIANGRKSFLYQSQIVEWFYLFIPLEAA